ncbi:DUF4372 domain-containing protein [Flavobacterium sp. XS2P12]|uniref:DUF4372 domain-containing protein n=1 Tax=Flavobacterium melibiosi TaxID=3398734 RepID=UPI003A8888DC
MTPQRYYLFTNNKIIFGFFTLKKRPKRLNSWNQLVSILICHFTKSHSICDTSNRLHSISENLNYLKKILSFHQIQWDCKFI